jgi:hypothetical protein
MTFRSHNTSFKASKEKISKLLRQKTEEAIDAIQDMAERQPVLRKGKAFLAKATETSKIGVAGIFAGVFCILFSLIYTMVCYANKRE